MKFRLRSLGSRLLGLLAIGWVFSIDSSLVAWVLKEEQPLSSSHPPNELEQLVYFEGNWYCEQPTISSSEPIALTWNVERDLNNFWYIGYAEEVISETNPEPVNSREFLGYDPSARHLVRLIVVGNGNSLSLISSGWQGEQLIWEGTLVRTGESIPIQQVITREDENKFYATYFVRDNTNNSWQPVIDEICDRRQIHL